ncbi:uncharacterized protein LOC113305354 [Papaver somniferum]|uniref:uncharacterized protein LOC113305354 n=1 Tax=Papaver somniferum TaxID=3469 RepID=UPI000E702BBF|nr:uncharacterized protein LOC113305354 [Papaver somniferum]
MKVSAPFIDVIIEYVKYVKSRQDKKERFANAITLFMLPGRSVSLDVDTRLNTNFKIIKDVVDSRQGFVRLAELDSDFTILPSSEECQQAIHICECLEVFDAISTKFAGIKYPKTNMYYNGVYDINKCIKGCETSDHVYIIEMRLKMRSKFDSY